MYRRSPVGPGSPKEAEEVSALETSVSFACRTASPHSDGAKVKSPSAQFLSPSRVSAQLVRTAHPTREFVSGIRTSPGAAGDLRHAPRGPPGQPNATGARRAVDRGVRTQPARLGFAERTDQEQSCYEHPTRPRRPGDASSRRERVQRTYKNGNARGLDGCLWAVEKVLRALSSESDDCRGAAQTALHRRHLGGLSSFSTAPLTLFLTPIGIVIFDIRSRGPPGAVWHWHFPGRPSRRAGDATAFYEERLVL